MGLCVNRLADRDVKSGVVARDHCVHDDVDVRVRIGRKQALMAADCRFRPIHIDHYDEAEHGAGACPSVALYFLAAWTQSWFAVGDSHGNRFFWFYFPIRTPTLEFMVFLGAEIVKSAQ